MSPPLRLDVRHYETIVAIIELGTMRDAARHLSITQPAMSHRLADAERRLGTALFTRTNNRRLRPTRHGEVVHQAAVRALAELRRAEEAVVASDADVVATARIGVGSYECYHWFPSFLDRLRDRHPALDVELVAVGDTPGHPLAAREVDVVLAPGEPEGDHELVPAFDDELVLVCSPAHPLADADRVEAHDLVDATYLTYNALPSPGFEYDRFVRGTADAPRIIRVVRQTSAIIELVAANAGVSILSRWATAPAVAAGRLHAAQCGDGLPLRWHIAHRRADDVAETVGRELAAHVGPGR